MQKIFKEILKNEWAFLTFRPFKPDLVNDYNSYFVFGFVITWLCGVGRYW